MLEPELQIEAETCPACKNAAQITAASAEGQLVTERWCCSPCHRTWIVVYGADAVESSFAPETPGDRSPQDPLLRPVTDAESARHPGTGSPIAAA